MNIPHYYAPQFSVWEYGEAGWPVFFSHFMVPLVSGN
jgi:hypothetical protein